MKKLALIATLVAPLSAGVYISQTTLTAQTAVPTNEFTAEEVAAGITLPKNEHNFFTCQGDTAPWPIINSDTGNNRFWMYEFTGSEPPFNGQFFVSKAELAKSPNLESINTLMSFKTGRRYYVMSDYDLSFRCGESIAITPRCGDDVQSNDEQCDDGNTQNGDGCSAQCTIESQCGNGTLETGEECDDSNAASQDGCSDSCTVELGYSCKNTPSECNLLIPTLPGGGSAASQPTTDPSSSSSTSEPQNDDDDSTPAYTVELHRASILNDTLYITYSKNFTPCAKLFRKGAWSGDNPVQPDVICNAGDSLNESIPLRGLSYPIENGNRIRLCHPTDPSVCTGYIKVNEESAPAAAEFLSVRSGSNPDGSSITTGVREIGRFTFVGNMNPTTAEASLGEIEFSVAADNVALRANAFTLINTTTPNQTTRCNTYYADGTAYSYSRVSGTFLVRCPRLRAYLNSNATITAGQSATFVLQADVYKIRVNNAKEATLQTSLKREGQVQWLYTNDGTAEEMTAVRAPENTIYSTLYLN